MSREMYNYKRKAIRIAKDFRYTTEIIEAIHKAKQKTKYQILWEMQDWHRRYKAKWKHLILELSRQQTELK